MHRTISATTSVPLTLVEATRRLNSAIDQEVGDATDAPEGAELLVLHRDRSSVQVRFRFAEWSGALTIRVRSDGATRCTISSDLVLDAAPWIASRLLSVPGSHRLAARALSSIVRDATLEPPEEEQWGLTDDAGHTEQPAMAATSTFGARREHRSAAAARQEPEVAAILRRTTLWLTAAAATLVVLVTTSTIVLARMTSFDEQLERDGVVHAGEVTEYRPESDDDDARILVAVDDGSTRWVLRQQVEHRYHVGAAVDVLVDPGSGRAKVRGELYAHEVAEDLAILTLLASLCAGVYWLMLAGRRVRTGLVLRAGPFRPVRVRRVDRTPSKLDRLLSRGSHTTWRALLWVTDRDDDLALRTRAGTYSARSMTALAMLSPRCLMAGAGRSRVLWTPGSARVLLVGSSRLAWRDRRRRRLLRMPPSTGAR